MAASPVFTQSQRLISLRQVHRRRSMGPAIDWGPCSEGRLLPTAGLAGQFQSLLSTAVAIVARRCRPSGQNSESLLAHRASAPAYPDPIVPFVMSLLAPASMADDRVQAANRTSARQLRQADLSYPGSALSSVHGSAIKRITAGVKARRWSHRQVQFGDWPSPSCRDSVERKKNECILARG